MRRLIILKLVFLASLAIFFLVRPTNSRAQSSCCANGYDYYKNVCLTNSVPYYCASTFGPVLQPFFPSGTDLALECVTLIGDVAAKVGQASDLCKTLYQKINHQPPPFDNIFVNACIGAVNTIVGVVTHIQPVSCPEDSTCNNAGICVVNNTLLVTTKICQFVAGTNHDTCESCFNSAGVYTAFGCIKTNPQQFVADVLKLAIGIAGGIAFLMIIYGGFTIMTSSGNPEKLTNGKEIIISAIARLLLIVFSVVILKIIGVDILGIPGFGG